MVEQAQDEKSYEDYFEEFYGTSPQEPETSQEPEPEPEPEQEEQEQEEREEEEQEKEEPEQRAASDDEDKEDPYGALLDRVDDPELKKQVQHLVQSDRSQKGRVSALTKKLQKLEEYYSNAISQAQASEASRSKPAPASTAPKENPKGREEEIELPPEVAALKETAPAVYKAAKALYESSSKRDLETVRQEYEERIKPLEESAVREANQREAQRLEQMAAELFDSENTNISVRDVIGSSDFAAWLRGQPQTIRQIYQNARTADEAILVLNKFENDYEYMRKLNERTAPREEPAQNERKEKASSSKGDALKAKRETTKQRSVSPKSKSAATAAVDSTDYDAIFNHFWGEKGIYRTKRHYG